MKNDIIFPAWVRTTPCKLHTHIVIEHGTHGTVRKTVLTSNRRIRSLITIQHGRTKFNVTAEPHERHAKCL